MAPEPQRTQEQSIKARKNELFEVDRPLDAATGPRRSFQDCLRTTPADPLSTPIKALLWTLGTLVILLLLAALATSGHKKPARKPLSGLAPPSAFSSRPRPMESGGNTQAGRRRGWAPLVG